MHKSLFDPHNKLMVWINFAQRKLVDVNFFSVYSIWCGAEMIWRLICMFYRHQKRPQALHLIESKFNSDGIIKNNERPHPIDLNWWLEKKKKLCRYVCVCWSQNDNDDLRIGYFFAELMPCSNFRRLKPIDIIK